MQRVGQQVPTPWMRDPPRLRLMCRLLLPERPSPAWDPPRPFPACQRIRTTNPLPAGSPNLYQHCAPPTLRLICCRGKVVLQLRPHLMRPWTMLSRPRIPPTRRGKRRSKFKPSHPPPLSRRMRTLAKLPTAPGPALAASPPRQRPKSTFDSSSGPDCAPWRTASRTRCLGLDRTGEGHRALRFAAHHPTAALPTCDNDSGDNHDGNLDLG